MLSKEEYRKAAIKNNYRKACYKKNRKIAVEELREEGIKKYYKNKAVENSKKELGTELRKQNIEKYYNEKHHQNIQTEIYKSKRFEDVICKIMDNLTKRTLEKLKKEKIDRVYKHRQIIGCNNDELKEHLEKQFKPNMTFENYGDWELDHIIPISSFNLHNEEEMFKCFNYKNIQPLWKNENRSKSNKIPESTIPSNPK